jgi:hypothetical protein
LKRLCFEFSHDALKWDACFLCNSNTWLRAPAAAPFFDIQANVIKIGLAFLTPELPPWLIHSVDAAMGQIAIVRLR